MRRYPFRLGWRRSNPSEPDFAGDSTDTEVSYARVYGSAAFKFHSPPLCATDPPTDPVDAGLLRTGAASQCKYRYNAVVTVIWSPWCCSPPSWSSKQKAWLGYRVC